LGSQLIVFYFVARLVDPGRLPVYGGTVPSYLAFVAIGLVINLTAGVLLHQVGAVMRQEQLAGTLESLLATPTTNAALQLVSGAVFPIALLPPLLRALAGWNPFAITIDGARSALLGGTGWGRAADALVRLVPLSLAGLLAGVVCFRLALARERRRGTLGLY